LLNVAKSGVHLPFSILHKVSARIPARRANLTWVEAARRGGCWIIFACCVGQYSDKQHGAYAKKVLLCSKCSICQGVAPCLGDPLEYEAMKDGVVLYEKRI